MHDEKFLADRVKPIGPSGIRKVFDLAASMDSPIDLSIGQPDFDVPEPARQAAIRAIGAHRNGYTVTQGIPELRARIRRELAAEFDQEPEVMVTSGVSGGLLLALLATVNPGDEVVFTDPYFVSYPHLVHLVGGVPVPVPVYDDFRLHPERIAAAITPKTRLLMLNSPANPTGVVYRNEDLRAVAQLAIRHDLLVISDEIYQRLSYDRAAPSAFAEAPGRTLILRGFGKSYGMTGWRLGYAAGPPAIIAEMCKLQQYTFVCAPQPLQWGALTGMDCDMSGHVADYRTKRDLVCGLLEKAFEFVRPEGGFYVFPKAPSTFPSAAAFVEQAIRNQVLIIPGSVFSRRDTHFRISYAAPNETIRRGCEVLCRLAKS